MASNPRVVIDSNVLISRPLVPGSVPARAVEKAVATAEILVSDDTLAELAIVLARSKLDPYLTLAERQEFIRLFGRLAERVPITYKVHACRDRKDNIVLEVAVNGRADQIVTGDQDLLQLGTFQDISIITPSRFIEI